MIGDRKNRCQPERLDQIECLRLCRELVPGGRKVGSEYHSASLQGGHGDRCRVHLKSGAWSYMPRTLSDRNFISSDYRLRRTGKSIQELVQASIGLSYVHSAAYLKGFIDRSKEN